MNTHSRDTWSIALACFLGALIGALTSLEIAARFSFGKMLWPLGALLGGVIGWIACDPAEFRKQLYANTLRKIKDCRHKVQSWFANQGKKMLNSAIGSVCIAILIASWFLPMYFICIMKSTFFQPGETGELFFLLIPTTFFTLVAYGIGLVLSAFVWITLSNIFEFDFNLWDPTEKGSKTNSPLGFLLVTSPLSMTISALIATVIVIAFLVRAFYGIAKDTFIKVHSEKRLICLVDSAIGAGVGYYFGSAILGGLAGSMIGVINYELVSVRWLKLVSRS